MDKNHFIGEPLTGPVYIGYERGQWPIHVFDTAEQAAYWLDRGETVRYVWRYELTDPVAMELVPKVIVNATLREAK